MKVLSAFSGWVRWAFSGSDALDAVVDRPAMDRRGAARICGRRAAGCLAEKEDPPRPDGSYSPRFYLWIVALLPWLMAAGVKANSLLDTSTVEIHHQTVISSESGIYRTKVRVTSWRPGRTAENVRTDPDKTCPPGSSITIEIKSGALQLPWFSGISCR